MAYLSYPRPAVAETPISRGPAGAQKLQDLATLQADIVREKKVEAFAKSIIDKEGLARAAKMIFPLLGASSVAQIQRDSQQREEVRLRMKAEFQKHLQMKADGVLVGTTDLDAADGSDGGRVTLPDIKRRKKVRFEGISPIKPLGKMKTPFLYGKLRSTGWLTPKQRFVAKLNQDRLGPGDDDELDEEAKEVEVRAVEQGLLPPELDLSNYDPLKLKLKDLLEAREAAAVAHAYEAGLNPFAHGLGLIQPTEKMQRLRQRRIEAKDEFMMSHMDPDGNPRLNDAAKLDEMLEEARARNSTRKAEGLTGEDLQAAVSSEDEEQKEGKKKKLILDPDDVGLESRITSTVVGGRKRSSEWSSWKSNHDYDTPVQKTEKPAEGDHAQDDVSQHNLQRLNSDLINPPSEGEPLQAFADEENQESPEREAEPLPEIEEASAGSLTKIV